MLLPFKQRLHCVALAILLIMPLLLQPGVVFAQEQSLPPLKSACELDYPPFCIVNSDGSVDGFSIELLRATLATMHRQATFVTGPWTEVKGMLERGEIDVLPLVGRTPEREKAFDFSVPYLTMHGTIVSKIGSPEFNDLSDLKDKKIAVMKNDNAEEFVRRSFPDYNIIATSTFPDAFAMLARNECDAVVIQKLVALMLIKEHGFSNLQFSKKPLMDFRQDFCFAVKTGDKDTLSFLNEGLALVIADGTYRRLHAKWFAQLELPESRHIILGGDNDYPPYEFIDRNGKPAGYNVDIARAIFKSIGIEMEIQLGPWNEMINKLKAGEIDGLQGMLYSELRNEIFDFSPPHSINSGVIVSRSDQAKNFNSLNSLKGAKIAVQDSDIMHEFARINGLASFTTAFSSQEEAMKSVLSGAHDCALVARLSALYWKERNGWKNLSISEKELISHDYCMVVNKGNKALMAKIGEGLRSIEDSGEFREIQRKWFGLHVEKGVSMKRLIRYLTMVGAPLVLAGLLLFFWSWTLRRQVAARTEELKASEEKFRNLIEGAPEAIFVQTDGVFSYINQAGCRLFGAKDPNELLGQKLISRFDESFHDLIQHRIKLLNIEKKFVHPLEIVAISMGNERLTVETSATPINYEGKNGAVVFVRDLSERKRLEGQLRQAQKLESIGLLAGGVAHDYNNMLSVILGYAELTLGIVSDDKKSAEYVAEIIKAAKKSGEITAQLLTFARQQPVSPKIINLQTTIDSIIKMLRRLIGENIKLCWQSSGKDKNCPILIDPIQFDQILANLVINARDAIKEAGTINIVLNRATILDNNLQMLKPGEYAILSVSDNGCGMSPDEVARIFDPFFTTKDLGKGTGLGLATVYGIVKQNDGFIDVQSTPGDGSTFNVFLKIAASDQITTEHVFDEVEEGQGELILVVEDDPSILSMSQQILEGMGYRVITANNPLAALELAQSCNEKISLVLSDVIMPEMNGKDLTRKLRQMLPDIKCLLMTGYAADTFADDFFKENKLEIIAKPFSISGLSQKVKAVMEAKG